MERFFLSLKMERVWHRDYANHTEAIRDITQYIVVFYNGVRLHSTLGYLSPIQFERQMAKLPIELSNKTWPLHNRLLPPGDHSVVFEYCQCSASARLWIDGKIEYKFKTTAGKTYELKEKFEKPNHTFAHPRISFEVVEVVKNPEK